MSYTMDNSRLEVVSTFVQEWDSVAYCLTQHDTDSFLNRIRDQVNQNIDLRTTLPLILNEHWFKALPEEWVRHVNDILSLDISPLPCISPNDFQSLKSDQRLNEELANAYLDLIAKRFKVVICPTLYSDRRLPDFLSYELLLENIQIFIPVFINDLEGHWTFIRLESVGRSEVVVEYYDPLDGFHAKLAPQLKEWLSCSFPRASLLCLIPEFRIPTHATSRRGMIMLMVIRRLAAGESLEASEAEAEAILPTFHRQLLAEVLGCILDPTLIDYRKFIAKEKELPKAVRKLKSLQPVFVDERTLLKSLSEGVRAVRGRKDMDIATDETLHSLYKRCTDLNETSFISRFNRARFASEFQKQECMLLGQGLSASSTQEQLLKQLGRERSDWVLIRKMARNSLIWCELIGCAVPYLGEGAVVMIDAVLGSTTDIERLNGSTRNGFIEDITALLRDSHKAQGMLASANPLYGAIASGVLPQHVMRIETRLDLETTDFATAVSMDVAPLRRALKKRLKCELDQ